MKALKKCEELGVRSVSIPMLGASEESLNEDYARAIASSVALAALGKELRSVSRVRLVAYEEVQRLAFGVALASVVHLLEIDHQWSDSERAPATWQGANDTDA